MTTPLSRAPVRLGGLAVIPFVAGAVLVWTADQGARPAIAQALSAYAAVVVAFIGAIHWGLAFAQPSRLRRTATRSFVWGVVPSLVAWGAVLAPARPGLVVDAVALTVCYGVDRLTYPPAGVAAWLPLRLYLTLVATLSCVAGALGA